MTSSLILQTSYLGDVILTTPLIAMLATRGPVDVVTTPAGAAVLANNPDVRRVITYDKRATQRGAGGLVRLAHDIRASSPSAVAYCVQGSVRTALLALVARYRHRVGFDTSQGRWLYTERVTYRRERHHAARVLQLALGGTDELPSDIHPRLFPGEAERSAVNTLLREAGQGGGDALVALAPGSAWATKRWPYFPELARRLRDVGRLVVLGGASDAPLARAIIAAGGDSVIDATGRLSLLASAELLSRCALLVTNDSAPQHLASAMGTPTVTVFGPTVPDFGFGPLAPGSRVAGHPTLPCRPCHPHGPVTCPLGHWRCMRDLDAIAVLDEAMAAMRAPTA